jgi:hypothetical protein
MLWMRKETEADADMHSVSTCRARIDRSMGAMLGMRGEQGQRKRQRGDAAMAVEPASLISATEERRGAGSAHDRI